MWNEISLAFSDLPADFMTVVLGVVGFWLLFVLAPLIRIGGSRRDGRAAGLGRYRLPGRGGRWD